MGKYFIFKLDDKKFAVPMLNINEVILPINITPIPDQEKHLKGVINLRGEIVTLVDLKVRLKLGKTEILDKRSCFVIFGVDQSKIAVMVDEVEEVISIDEDKIKNISDLKSTKFVEGIFRGKNDSIILIANATKLLEFDLIEKIKQAA